MKENLLVTLADRNYIEQAKQLFSGAYWNAGWKGDYMLLAHEIPEKDLKWFRDKGILIRKCKPIYKNPIGDDKYSPVVLDKFYLFTEEFKKWKHVVFLDGDIIIRSSLDGLTKTKKFSSLQISSNNFRDYFSLNNNPEISELKREYKLKRATFNSGVMSFDTNIIREDTFKKLMSLFEKYRNVINSDDSILNLFFYEQWRKIPLVYNIRVNHLHLPRNPPGIILHFERFFRTSRENSKPWDKGNPFYDEWSSNLEKVEMIDLDKIPEGKKLSNLKIYCYSFLLEINLEKIKQETLPKIKTEFIYLIHTPGRFIGQIGIFLKKHNPNLYKKLRGII